jgi:serine/threonine-protein kinase HipA
MQIAKQVYGINTAENAMIFFKDGTPAYITRRFDVKKEGEKWGKEDFASLSGKTKESLRNCMRT